MTPTFHGRPQLKAELLARIALHERADQIAAGAFASRRGGRLQVCAVGCAMVDPVDPVLDEPAPGWYEAHEERWGIPAWLGELEDAIFEALPGVEGVGWPRRFVTAIPVGVDLAGLPDTLALRRLRESVLPRASAWPEHVRSELETAIAAVLEALEGHGDRTRAAELAVAAEQAARPSEDGQEAARAALEAARGNTVMSAREAAWAAWLPGWRAEADRLVDELLRLGRG